MTDVALDARPRRELQRWVIAAFVLFFGVAGFGWLHRFFSDKFFLTTGDAVWIWEDHEVLARTPVVFFVTREFEVPEGREFVRIKIAGDPEYTLFLNGAEIGSGVVDREAAVDVYELTDRARIGGNRVVVALRSANGVGGFLMSISFGHMRENVIVSGPDWRAYSVWSDELLIRDVPGLATEKIIPLGRPPAGRWNYMKEVGRPVHPPVSRSTAPVRSIEVIAPVPQIRVISSVAVASVVPTAAVAFDFGSVRGRGRLTVPAAGEERVVRVRYANDESELTQEGLIRTLVFARGETQVTDPVEQEFRFMVVYDRSVSADVVISD